MARLNTGNDPTGRLGVVGYDVHTRTGEVVGVKAEFILYLSGDAGAEVIAEAHRKLALFFCSGDIDIVRAGDGVRCFYCASLNERGAKQCSQCGGPL